MTVQAPYRPPAILSLGGPLMSQPIYLSDDELNAVMNACRQLQLCDRDRFLKAVAQAIAELPERGPGAVHRAITTVWKGCFDPPDLRIDEPRSWAYGPRVGMNARQTNRPT